MNSTKARNFFISLQPVFGELYVLCFMVLLVFTQYLWLFAGVTTMLLMLTLATRASGGGGTAGLNWASATVVASAVVGGIIPAILVLSLLGLFSSEPNVGTTLLDLVLRMDVPGATWWYFVSTLIVAFTMAIYGELTCRLITYLYPGHFYDAVPKSDRPNRIARRGRHKSV